MSKICTIDGCEAVHEAKGYCREHYYRNRTTGSPIKKARRPNAMKSLICQFCENSFISRANNAKYCSSNCQERARYIRAREKRIAQAAKYREDNREKIRSRRREIYASNTEKFQLANRENYLKHREERIKAAAEYQSSHPEIVALTRSRRRAIVKFSITTSDHKKLLHIHRGCCAYCHVKLTAWGRDIETALQWDHVIPLSRGGVDGVGNLVPSCRSCNLSKNRSTVMEWKLRKARWYINREIQRLGGEPV